MQSYKCVNSEILTLAHCTHIVTELETINSLMCFYIALLASRGFNRDTPNHKLVLTDL